MDTTSCTSSGLRAVKAAHTVIWLSVEVSVAYLIFAGTRRSNRLVGVAGAVVLSEGVVYLANGARCPLSGLAEKMGAEGGSVTDIYMPRWLATNLPAIHVPLIALILYLYRPRWLR